MTLHDLAAGDRGTAGRRRAIVCAVANPMALSTAAPRSLTLILTVLALAVAVAIPTPVHAQTGVDPTLQAVADDVRLLPSEGADPATRIRSLTDGATAGRAIITTTAGFPDALASGVLQRGGHLVGATDGRLASEDRSSLNGATDIVILGGPQAVPDTLLGDLPLTAAVRRISGGERTETAAAIALAAAPDADTVIIARARGPQDNPTAGFIDAIGGGVLSAATGWPTLLVDGTVISQATRDALHQIDPDRLVVLGGEAAVPQTSVVRLAGDREVTRLAGADRYETAAEIALATRPDGAGQVLLLDGTDPDAWATGFAAAGPLADDGVVLLTAGEDVPAVTADALAALGPARLLCAAPAPACGQEADGDPAASDDDPTIVDAPPEFAIPEAGGRFDYDETIDARVSAARVNALDSYVDTAGSVLRYPSGGNVPVLFSGYGTAVQYAPDGLASPIDTTTYNTIIARVHSPEGGGRMVVETRSCANAVTDHCTVPSGILSQEYRQIYLTGGWETITLDYRDSAEWQQGPIQLVFLQLPPGSAMDDLRFTDGTPGAQLQIDAPAGATLHWDADDDPSNNTDPSSALWGPLPDGVLDSGQMPPGDYWVHTSADGSATSASQTQGPITIRPVDDRSQLPAHDVVEWSTLVRGRPWDFAPGSNDLAGLHHATLVDGPGLTAVNSDSTGDPYLFLDVPEPIDSTRFTHITLRIEVDGPFDLSGDPGGGTMARVLFQQNGTWHTGNDLLVLEEQTDYVIDMTDPRSLEPGEQPWTAAPVTGLRIDPNEDPGAGRRWTLHSVALTEGPPATPLR